MPGPPTAGVPARPEPVLGIVGRLALLGYFAWEAVRQLRSDDFAFSLFGGVIFGVHELGHLVFAPFGELLGVAGGSIAQILLPIGAIALFAKQKQRYAVAVCGCWLAISLAQLAVYVADARTEALELVSFSEDVAVHDWNYLLERFSLLRHDAVIARLVRVTGWLVVLTSVALGVRESSRRRAAATGGLTCRHRRDSSNG